MHVPLENEDNSIYFSVLEHYLYYTEGERMREV